jgi:hypothetical protein
MVFFDPKFTEKLEVFDRQGLTHLCTFKKVILSEAFKLMMILSQFKKKLLLEPTVVLHLPSKNLS